MQSVVTQIVVMLHATFGCMFLFFYRQNRTEFSRLIAQSWLLEAVRAAIILTQLNTTGWLNHWHTVTDCMGIVVAWWLLAGCADLANVKLTARLGRLYVGISIFLVLGLRYAAPQGLVKWFGYTLDEAGNLCVFVELLIIYIPMTVVRAMILYWFIGLWRRIRLPGALVASIFGVPYVVFILINPLQFYLKYYPDWLYFVWAARVLGFSLGLVMLIFDRQLLALRERERAYRTVVDTSHDLIWSVDVEGRWTFLNQATRRIYGYEPAEMLGQPFTRFLTPEQAQKDLEIFSQLKSGTPHFNYETVHLHKDGTPVNLSFNSVVLRSDHGAIIGISGTAQDITEKKKAEKAVLRLANFPQLNPNPVLEFQTDGTPTYQNPAARAMVAKIGVGDLSEMLPQNTRAIVLRCMATGQPHLRLLTTHGKSTLAWSFYPIASQQVVHCYIGDITERILLEEQLRQAQKMEAIGQLAGGVAHDFNNQLTAIIGNLSLLRMDEQVTPAMAESLEEIAQAANRAANLTKQLLAFSRRQVISIRALDLNDVVLHCSKLLQRLLGEDIAINLDHSPEPLTFNGDAGMIEQVLINLAVNARDAMAGGGTLRITTGSEMRAGQTKDALEGTDTPAPFVTLTVSDTGAGIAPDVLPRIFEPFFTTKDVGKGTGLGLATVFGIVQQHHGWIEVQSEVARGTTFRVFLPKLATAPDVPLLETQGPAGRGRGEVILFVEDEPSLLEIGKKALAQRGYRVIVAANGQAALAEWAQHKADIALLVSDVVMPGGMSGMQLAQRLLQEKPELRVIFTSGYNKEFSGNELTIRNGLNYLHKPYDLEALYRAVWATLDAAAVP